MAKNVTAEVAALHHTVKEFLKEGMTEEDIIKQLKKKGIGAHYAETIIENVLADKADTINFRKLLLMGLFIIAADLLIGYLSYTRGIHLGEIFYAVFSGIMVAGVVIITRAFILFKK